MRLSGPTARALGGPTAAIVALAAISLLRFVFPDAQGTMLFGIVPVVLLGMMLGFRAGLLAALFASAVALVWAATSGHGETLSYITQPITFLVLGAISGYFAKGALGAFDLGSARTCSQLRRAIGSGELVLHYQPIVRPDGELLFAEGLARWQQPDGGLRAPAEFIPAAEGDDRTLWELTVDTLERGIHDASQLGDSLVVAVNLSPVILAHHDLANAIGEALGRGGLSPSRLAVEVTETAVSAEDEATVIESLSAIQRIGVGRMAIDDFGIGHSSLARLGRLPVDTVKIDRKLIADSDRAETAAVIRGMIELAHAVQLTVVAEGVEDARTWDWLIGANCDALQGFHLSRPMPPEALSEWLATRQGATRA
jgi:EAL domain-containing protein (putative c-di-GMP-specific phosphodiesterase class I)